MVELIALGHSITYGKGNVEGGWVERLKRELEAGSSDSEVYNLGIPGDTTEELLERMEDEIERRVWPEYDLVIVIQIGANDLQIEDGKLRVNPEEFRENLGTIVEGALEFTENVILLGDGYMDIEGPLPWAPEKKVSDSRAEEYHIIRRELSDSRNLTYLSIRDNWSREEWTGMLDDGVHPDTDGHRELYRIAKKRLKEENLIPDEI